MPTINFPLLMNEPNFIAFYRFIAGNLSMILGVDNANTRSYSHVDQISNAVQANCGLNPIPMPRNITLMWQPSSACSLLNVTSIPSQVIPDSLLKCVANQVVSSGAVCELASEGSPYLALIPIFILLGLAACICVLGHSNCRSNCRGSSEQNAYQRY